MIIIADSGSTKTNWCLVENKEVVGNCTTLGMNPYFLTSEEMLNLLQEDFSLSFSKVDAVYFYGAGCTPMKEKEIASALISFFKADRVEVKSDLWAAARSLGQDSACIVSILGTGSNSCLYDGKEIAENVSPLGYILGDEGSGAYLGKLLVGDVLKNQLPQSTIQNFFDTYSLTKEEIIERVYRGKFPNRFLAQFIPFIKSHEKDIEMKTLLSHVFDAFILRNLFQYTDYKILPVHFTGSIAYYFKEQLEERMKHHQLQIGKICQEPMSGLVDYHTKIYYE